MKTLVIVGAEGSAREVLDVALAINASEKIFNILGFISDFPPPNARPEYLGAPWLGTINKFIAQGGSNVHFVVGVGDPIARRKLSAQLINAGYQPATLVHPSSTQGRQVEIGPGSVICSHASLMNNIVVGSFCLISVNCTIGHDVVLEDFVTVNPLSSISGNVRVETEVLVGAGSTTLQGLNVGRSATIGAGAVVTRNVDPGLTVVGAPAKPIRR